MRKAKAYSIIFIVASTILAGGIFVYNNHSLHEKDPWYHTVDQDMFITTEAMALNTKLMPSQSIHPGFGTKFLYAYYFKLMKKMGRMPVSTIEDFEQSSDPLVYWPWLIGYGRIFSLVLAMILCAIMGGMAWQLTGSVLFLPLGFFMGTISYGIMYQSLMIRTELVSSIFGSLAFLFMVQSLRTQKLLTYVLFLILSGVFVGLALFTKIQTYPFLAIIMFWFLFIERGRAEKSTKGEDAEFYNTLSTKFGKGLLNGLSPINYYYMFRILPAIILTLICSCCLMFCSRYPPYYVPALLILTLFGPLYILRPKEKALSWLYAKLEHLINFMGGIIFSSIVPMILLIPIIGVANTLTYWGETLWIVFHPMKSFKLYASTSQHFINFAWVRPFMEHYFNSYFWFIPFILFFIIFCKNQKRDKIVFVVLLLITMSYASFNSTRSLAPHYIIYTDIFLICALIVAFWGIEKHLIETLKLNKYLLKHGILLIFIIFLGLSGVTQLNKLESNYKVSEPYTYYPLSRIYKDYGWYVERYDKAMERAYKSSEGFLERIDRFLKKSENNYVRYN